MVSSNFCDTASSDNLTPAYWKLEGEEVDHGYVSAAFLVLFECVGLPWNLLVIITIFKEKLFHQPTIILLLNLTLADIFLLVGPIPLILTTAFAGEFILGSTDSVRCRTCHMDFILLTPIFISLLTVALMSLDRFIYIYAPFKYERSLTKDITVVAVTAVILMGIGMGLAVQFTPGNLDFFPAYFFCSTSYINSSSYIPPVIVAIIILATIAFIICINCSFAFIVAKNIKAVYAHNDNNDKRQHQRSKLDSLKKQIKSTRSKKQRRLCVMVSALICSSLLVIFPWLGIIIYLTSTTSSNSVPVLVTIFLIMNFSLVVVHPAIHTCILPDLYEPMKKLITCGYFPRKKKMKFSGKKRKSELKCTECLGNMRGEKTSFLITAIKAAISPEDVTSDSSELTHSSS